MKNKALFIKYIYILALPSIIQTNSTPIKDLYGKGVGTLTSTKTTQTAEVCTMYVGVVPIPATSVTQAQNASYNKEGYYLFGTSPGLAYYGQPQANYESQKGKGDPIKNTYGFGKGTYYPNNHIAVICSSYTDIISVPANIPAQLAASYEKSGYFSFGKSLDGTSLYYGKPQIKDKVVEKRY